MEQVQLSVLANVLGSTAPVEASITEICTDTRTLQPGCLFLALKGASFDGHDFVERAIAAGAVAAVTERQIADCPCLVVADTGRALLQIAAWYRSQFHPILVGVTGSVGKTTTKEMIALVLAAKYHTLKTAGNLNNEIGLPKTLLQLTADHTAAVIEMGMSHFGEISRLSQTAQPTIGVITNIGYSHIENLKTQEGILKAKMEILDGMAEDAPLIVNGDDPLLRPLKQGLTRPVYTYGIQNQDADAWATDIEEQDGTTTFSLHSKQLGTFAVTLPCIGVHNVMNAMAAFCVGRCADLSPQQICEALAQYHTVGFRQNITKRGAYTVLADCYNASPDSMKAALSVLDQLPCEGRLVAVLGDMLELGEMSQQLHELVGTMAAASKVQQLFCYGDQALHIARAASNLGASAFHTDDRVELCCAVRAYLRPGDVILFKASRGMRLEDCIAEIFRQEESRHAVLD